MDKHLESLIDAHVHIDDFENGPLIPIAKVAYLHQLRLLVLQGGKNADGAFALDPLGQHVVEGLAAIIFFDVDVIHAKIGRIGLTDWDGRAIELGQVAPVAAPLVAHQLQTGKTQHNRRFEVVHIHAHKADRAEVADAANGFFLWPIERDAEAIPDAAPVLAFPAVGDKRRIGHIDLARVGRVCPEGDFVLKISFRFVQGVVLVDVFRIGDIGCGLPHIIGLVGAGVSFGIVEALVALQHAGAGGEAGVPVVKEIIASRVLAHQICSCLILSGDGRNVVGKLHLLFVIVQAIEAEVLPFARGDIVVEGAYNLLGDRHPPPGGIVRAAVGAGGARQAVFEEEAGIPQHIFGDIAEVDVQVALSAFVVRVGIGRAQGIQEGAQQPEFEEFDIGRLEVVGGQGPSDTSPAGLWVPQADSPVGSFYAAGITRIALRQVKVVGPPFAGVVSQVKGLHVGQLVGRYGQVGEDLCLWHQAGIGVVLITGAASNGVEAVPI